MPGTKTRIASSAEVVEGALFQAQAAGRRILLSRIGGRVHAVIDRCPHMGMSLARGKLEDGVVTCPWHHSRFDFCTGRNMDWASAFLGMPLPKWTHKALAMGKAPAPLATLPADEIAGEIFVTV